MKVELTASCRTIPAVGNVWKHEGLKDVYMRIPDGDGQRAIGMIDLEDVFFSVDLKYGAIVHTPVNSGDIIVFPTARVVIE